MCQNCKRKQRRLKGCWALFLSLALALPLGLSHSLWATEHSAGAEQPSASQALQQSAEDREEGQYLLRLIRRSDREKKGQYLPLPGAYYQIWRLGAAPGAVLSDAERRASLETLASLSAEELTARYGQAQQLGPSDAQGELRLYLGQGLYYLREQTPGASYLAVPTLILLPGSLKGGDELVYLKEEKELPPPEELAELLLQKKDASTGQLISGARFRLSREDGQGYSPVYVRDGQAVPVGEGLADWGTDSQGRMRIRNLLPGRYRLEELEAPKGYRLLAQPLEFELQSRQEFRLDVPNQQEEPRGGLYFRKLDHETQRPLAGAQFKLLKVVEAEGGTEALEEYLRGGQAYVVQSDAEGYFAFEDLPYGDYAVLETQAPEGYSLLGEDLRFRVDGSQNEALRYSINNDKKPPLPYTGSYMIWLLLGLSGLAILLGTALWGCGRRLGAGSQAP